ncbi:MAG: alternative ribosome rescue aminoacyl-tRNA hydrolase ArfB [Gemmatimonadaceae bacterium]
MATRSSPAEPDDDHALYINARVSIPRAELVVRATRASGAGGQHVNKTSSRVEITWNPSLSGALSGADRARLLNQLTSRVSESGEVRVVASDTRSQLQNRELAESRLAELVRSALVIPKARKATRPSRAAKQARLDEKRHKAQKKRERGRWSDD